MQDAEVETHIEAGQRAAVEALYRQHGDRLWRALRLATGSSDIASDALAEAFDAIASQLLRYRDGRGDDWADIIDILTMHPETRRRVVRLLGELEAAGTAGGDL